MKKIVGSASVLEQGMEQIYRKMEELKEKLLSDRTQKEFKVTTSEHPGACKASTSCVKISSMAKNLGNKPLHYDGVLPCAQSSLSCKE